MDCDRECYRIGGPWIAEDPNCPVHGYEAVREREEREAAERALLSRIEELERRLTELEESYNSLNDYVNRNMMRGT